MTGLPVVSKEVRLALSRDIEENYQSIIDTLKRMAKENPQVADFISQYTAALETTPEQQVTAVGMVLVYRMLESQLEADRLNDRYESS